jgi:hypothetical protein
MKEAILAMTTLDLPSQSKTYQTSTASRLKLTRGQLSGTSSKKKAEEIKRGADSSANATYLEENMQNYITCDMPQ